MLSLSRSSICLKFTRIVLIYLFIYQTTKIEIQIGRKLRERKKSGKQAKVILIVEPKYEIKTLKLNHVL